MIKIKTLILDPISETAVEYGNDNLELITWNNPSIKNHFADAEAIIVRTFKVTSEIIESMPKLKIIAKHGVGIDNINLEHAREKNIIITNTPTANMNSVAELIFALTLACARKIVESNNRIFNGIEENSPLDLRGIELENKTLGLIGLGKIGTLVGYKFKQAFNMKILVYDKYMSLEDCEKLGFYKYENLDSLLIESNVVNLSVPLTPETKNMITSRELSLMKKNAILINTSRGGIINERDLYTHLKTEQHFSASLDAFEIEPVPKSHPLLTCDNFIATPHIGANTDEALIRMGTQAIDEIIRFKKGIDNLSIVN